MHKKIIQKLATLYVISINFLYAKTTFAVSSNELLAPPQEDIQIITSGQEQIEAVKNLPDVSLEGAVATAIKTVLGWSFVLSLIAFIVAAIYMIAFEGEDEKITKAKSIIIYLIFGIVVISIAYGIVTGIIQLKLFK